MTTWPAFSHATLPTPEQASNLAQAARAALANDEEPLHVRRACEVAGVQLVSRPLHVGSRRHRAMLAPTVDGFRVIVDPLVWRSARPEQGRRFLRSVLAHELGHTFFYVPGRPPRRTRSPDRQEENFCHRFATSLLVPWCAARAAKVDSRALHALAGRYDVSLRVAAWALVRAQTQLSVLMLRWAPHPARGGEPAMRVLWGASEQFIARGESFKSPLAGLPPGQQGSSSELLRLAGREREVDIDAWRYRHFMLAVLRDRAPATSLEDGASPVLPQLELFS